jgi:phage tail tape-measure protein
MSGRWGFGKASAGDRCENAMVITPSDATDLSGVPIRYLRCGGAGNLTVQMRGHGSGGVLVQDVVAGEWLRISPQKVMSTGTAASKITAHW